MDYSPELVKRAAALETPVLILDRRLVRQAARALLQALPGIELLYAVKANPHPAVLRALAQEGCGFEVSSVKELEAVLALGVPAQRLISSNPIKPVDFLRRSRDAGLRTFAFDSRGEVDKLAQHAAGSRVYLRLVVDNTGSEWPLSKKYGVNASEALELFTYAKGRGLEPYGLTFHVGSQCLNKDNWANALYLAGELFTVLARHGIGLSMLSLGGGMPVRHTKPVPSFAEIGEVVARAVAEALPPGLRLTMEPGRALVGEAATLVTTVIGKAARGPEEWLYTDVGVFNGLMETVGGLKYELRTERSGPPRTYTVAGPSCDSFDMMFQGITLPEVEAGDRLYIMNAGAYTTAYASSFNGFGPPRVHLIG
ncbi:MAG: type III PLP-dependent enzyme [Chloroflexi bacterium]|nr:type III PLP-dependent enzyme [Chloroflexota bacterium]